MIQVLKLTNVFGGVLSNMYCIMMSSIEEPPKICCLMLAFLSTTTKNRINPTLSNDTRNGMVIINSSLLQ
jgi:hypothetical protein